MVSLVFYQSEAGPSAWRSTLYDSSMTFMYVAYRRLYFRGKHVNKRNSRPPKSVASRLKKWRRIALPSWSCTR